MESLIKRLSQPRVIRFQLAAYAQLLRIYDGIERSIEQSYWNHPECRLSNVLHLDMGDKSVEYNMPKLHRLVKWYNSFSTTCLLFILAKSLLPWHRWIQQGFGRSNLSLPAHCYVPGRFIFLATMETYFEPLFAGAILIWRLVVIRGRQFKLNLIVFLLQDEQTLGRFYGRIAQESSADMELADYQPSATRYEQFLRDTLGYTLNLPSRCSIYRIRFNRTPGARAKLIAETARVGLVAGPALIVSISLVLALVIIQLLNDKAYLKRYPDCHPLELEQLAHSTPSSSSSWYSEVTFSRHKLLMMPFDLAENGVLWCETLAAAFVGVPYLYLLNYDLMYCWRHISRQLKQLERRLHQRGSLASVSLEDLAPNKRSKLLLSKCWSDHHHHDNEQHQDDCQLAKAIYGCQCEVSEFFRQFRHVDYLVSNTLTAAVVLAVGTFSFITYSYMSRLGQVTMEARVLQVVTFILLTFMSLAVFALQKLIRPSYSILCSIMAHDQSCHKWRHIKILEQFSTDWTLFHSHHYRPTTLLSLVGWTFSGATIAESFLGRRDNNNNNSNSAGGGGGGVL